MDIQTLCLECTKDPYSRHGIINPAWSHLNESYEVLILECVVFLLPFRFLSQSLLGGEWTGFSLAKLSDGLEVIP